MRLTSRSLALLYRCTAVPAFAQAGPPAAVAAASVKNDSGVIIVTAQRRDKRLRDVPIAIKVLIGDRWR